MLFKPNKMEVECSVDNCEFWHDNYCKANKLNVNTNSGIKEADTSDCTCCDTFVCKCDNSKNK